MPETTDRFNFHPLLLDQAMVSPLRITVLVDHTSSRSDLETEHGLSLLLEADGLVLLFDAGASGAALRNAERLGLPWRRISHIILSHAHRDHTGGLEAFLSALPEAKVYLHPRTLARRYSLRPGTPARDLSMPDAVQALLQARMGQLHWSTAPMTLAPGLGLTGPIPRRHQEEARSGPFFLDPEGGTTDPFVDDQALWLATDQGLVVLLGCAHAGLANTLDQVRKLSGGDSIHAVVGGLHLSTASDTRLQASLQTLRDHRVVRIASCHCTGRAATELIQDAFGDQGKPLGVGDSLVFMAKAATDIPDMQGGPS